jgi:nicotinamidase-related amidase
MLDINNAIVLAIDLQEKLVRATNADEEIQNAKKLIEAANILNIPVIVTEQYPKGLGNTVEAIKNLFNNSTAVIEKTAFSALMESEVLETLIKSGRKQVILFGIELHICVYQTALELIEKGFEVYLIKDASKSRKDFEFNCALELLKNKAANVTCLEMVLFELLKSSKHLCFKEIQALIK